MAIERAIAEGRWPDARRLVQGRLTRESDSHWLLSRLALTHYEQHEYKEALEIDGQAMAIAPKCPLVLWGYAGTLQMLGREEEAIVIFERIASRGIESLARDQCGEGMRRARGLHADVLYRLAQCYHALGDASRAKTLVKQALGERGPGSSSIYPIREVRALADRIESSVSRLTATTVRDATKKSPR